MWRLLIAEARFGYRWLAGTERGAEYRNLLSHADNPPAPPGLSGRGIGDWVSPFRASSATAAVNAATRAVGDEAAGWRVDRLRSFVGALEQEREQSGG